MAITLWRRRRPFEGLTGWFNDFDTWFDRDFLEDITERNWLPAVDVEEKDGKYLIKADLPGMKKEDIHIELKNGYLKLKGERRSEHEDKKENYHRIERTYGSFERNFRVPEGLTEKDVKARYHDGVLELSIPTPKTVTPKAIDIKVE